MFNRLYKSLCKYCTSKFQNWNQYQDEDVQMLTVTNTAGSQVWLDEVWPHDRDALAFGPVYTFHYQRYVWPTGFVAPAPCAVGIMDQSVILRRQPLKRVKQQRIPFTAIQGIVQRHDSVLLQCPEQPDHAPIHYFKLSEEDAPRFADTLHKLGTIPLTHRDRGPTQATRMTQDIYGQWHTGASGIVYLGAGGVVFDWHDPIPLAHIRSMVVAEQPGSLTQALLSITYQDADDARHTVGFLMRTEEAPTWANFLNRQSGVSAEYFDGQKKKS